MFGHNVSILKNTYQRERESVAGISLKNPASTLLFSIYFMQIALFLFNKIKFMLMCYAYGGVFVSKKTGNIAICRLSYSIVIYRIVIPVS